MKKALALLSALTMLISFTACGNDIEETIIIPETSSYSENSETDVYENVTEPDIPESSEIDTSDISTETTEAATTSQDDADPSQWSDEKIIDFM